MNRVKCVVAAVVLCLAASGCSQQAEQAAPEETLTPVETASAAAQTIRSELVYAGQVSPVSTVQVTGKLSGKVEQTFYNVGDYVTAGSVLYSLDKKDIENQIRQLQSQLNVASQGVRSAQSSLDTVTGGQYEAQVQQQETAIESSRKQVENAEITLENAQYALENAQLAMDNAILSRNNVQDTYDKVKFLYEAGVSSQVEFDNAQFALDQCLAAVNQAQVGLESAQLTINQAKVGLDTAKISASQAENSLELSSGKIVNENVEKAQIGVGSAAASVQSVQVQIDIARETLADATVTTPISGVVSLKNAKAGEMISSAVAAYVISDMDNVLVKVGVSELIINKLAVGQTVDVTVASASDTPFKGVIDSVSPAADQTSTFPLEIKIANPEGVLKPGMFAEARFVREESAGAIVLPRSAVMEDDVEKYVYVNDNGNAKRVVVTTGIDNGNEIEITSGLNVNDEVIVKGQTYVSNGDKLNVVATAGKEAQP